MTEVKNNPERVSLKDNLKVVPPFGYSSDEWDDAPTGEPVKLCRLEDPTCEACQ